jgi:hypothetical protein
LGPLYEEVINIFSVAIRLGLTSKDLNDPILYAYPTNSSDVVYILWISPLYFDLSIDRIKDSRGQAIAVHAYKCLGPLLDHRNIGYV